MPNFKKNNKKTSYRVYEFTARMLQWNLGLKKYTMLKREKIKSETMEKIELKKSGKDRNTQRKKNITRTNK